MAHIGFIPCQFLHSRSLHSLCMLSSSHSVSKCHNMLLMLPRRESCMSQQVLVLNWLCILVFSDFAYYSQHAAKLCCLATAGCGLLEGASLLAHGHYQVGQGAAVVAQLVGEVAAQAVESGEGGGEGSEGGEGEGARLAVMSAM